LVGRSGKQPRRILPKSTPLLKGLPNTTRRAGGRLIRLVDGHERRQLFQTVWTDSSYFQEVLHFSVGPSIDDSLRQGRADTLDRADGFDTFRIDGDRGFRGRRRRLTVLENKRLQLLLFLTLRCLQLRDSLRIARRLDTDSTQGGRESVIPQAGSHFIAGIRRWVFFSRPPLHAPDPRQRGPFRDRRRRLL